MSILHNFLIFFLVLNFALCSPVRYFVPAADALELPLRGVVEQSHHVVRDKLMDTEQYIHVGQYIQSKKGRVSESASRLRENISSDLNRILKTDSLRNSIGKIPSSLPNKIQPKTLQSIASSLPFKGEYGAQLSQWSREAKNSSVRQFQKSLPKSFNYVVAVMTPILKQRVDHNSQQELKQFFASTPETMCSAYRAAKSGVGHAKWQAITEGAVTSIQIVSAVGSAAGAGAGSLTGYAGLAAAVSQLGLGGVTTAMAIALGSHATGAAATSVVVSALGGPVVVTALLIGGTGAVAYGRVKLSEYVVGSMEGWAEQSCGLSIEQKIMNRLKRW